MQQQVDVNRNNIRLSHGTLQIQTIYLQNNTIQDAIEANGVRWKKMCTCNNHLEMPADAVLAGQDTDEDPIYVGRTNHMGALLPVKVIPDKKCAYAPCDGEEIQTRKFEVLCCQGASWVFAVDGVIPPNAIEGGRTSSGEVLYIGRGKFNGSLTPGKVVPSDRKLYIPYDNSEVVLKNFDVLVKQ